MRRSEIVLQQDYIELLLGIKNLPETFKTKLKVNNNNIIFTNEEELEKVLDLLPPTPLASETEKKLRFFLTDTLQKMS